MDITDIFEARARISELIARTPLIRCGELGEVLGCEAWLKPEMLQRSGSFKLRGALNAVLALAPESRARGVITSSSGNHGKAIAYAGRLTGTRATVVLPEDAPQAKIDGARELGAEVILAPRGYDERWQVVRSVAAERGCAIIHGYEDPNVQAGQGTIGLEILDDLPEVGSVLVPIGGGGLISGVATAIKSTRPRVRVIGIQAGAYDSFIRSREAGRRVAVPFAPTLADGLSCQIPGESTYPIVERYVDDIVRVSEDAIAEAMRALARTAHLIAEPSSVVGIAAVIEGAYRPRAGERAAFVLTSGNWDIDRIGRILIGEKIVGIG